MKKILFFFFAFTTLTTLSYASFPVSETANITVIEKSEIPATNSIEVVENEVSNPAQDLSEIKHWHWTLRVLLGLVLGLLVSIIFIW